MEQPYPCKLTSHSINTSFHSRVAQRMYALVGFRDEEATSMPARFDLTLMPKKNSGLAKFLGFFLAVLFFFVANSPAQTAAHSPGWVVLPVDEYRTLHARAYPTEREPEPPPVEATLTRVDYDLRINGDLASGRAGLTVDVLKDGWVRVPIPAGLLVREARLDGKLVSLVPIETSLPSSLASRTSRPAGMGTRTQPSFRTSTVRPARPEARSPLMRRSYSTRVR